MQIQTQILADVIVANKSLLFNESLFKGRGKGAWRKYHEVYCQLIAECISNERQHNHIFNSYDLGGRSTMMKLFKSDNTFRSINEKCGAFVATGTYKQGESNQAYMLNDSFLAKLDTLIDTDTLPVSKLSKWAVYKPESYDDSSFCYTSGHGITCFMMQSGKPVERLYAWALREAYRLHGNRIPQYYVKGKKTDRLYGKGPLAIGNISRELRAHVMQDYIEYDLSAASYTILFNLAKDKTLYPTIEQYVNDVKGFREQLCDGTDADVNAVKTVFLHKSFGSSLTFKTGIAKELPMTLVQQITKHPLFQQFNDELKQLKTELEALYPEKLKEFRTARDVYEEGHSKEGQYKGNYRSTYICWLYQKYEIEIIQLIRKELDDPMDCLLLHDAIYTKQKLDVPTLEAVVKTELGIDIRIG
ncbi:hypothetical protein ACS5HP_002909 [Vibrio alginolyticus]